MRVYIPSIPKRDWMFVCTADAAWANAAEMGSPGKMNCLGVERRTGFDIWNEGEDILRDAARTCTPLKQALDTWKDVTFDYASTDAPDFAPTPEVSM